MIKQLILEYYLHLIKYIIIISKIIKKKKKKTSNTNLLNYIIRKYLMYYCISKIRLLVEGNLNSFMKRLFLFCTI